MKAFVRVLIFLFISFIIMNLLIIQYEEELAIEEAAYSCEEYATRDITSNNSIYHQRSWKDSNYYTSYCSSYAIEDTHYSTSTDYRNTLTPSNASTFHEYWGNIYQQLVKFESDRLWALEDSLKNIGIRDSLNQLDFADMVVSFAQDIPYSYIMQESCDKAGNTPCFSDQRFGLLSPVEFLYTLKGDCDTRTTLLYKLLKHFGYDVKVVISSEYAHAMLAVNLPSTGDYIPHQGKRYYFWETTNVGWQLGMLGADNKNINYWKIALN